MRNRPRLAIAPCVVPEARMLPTPDAAGTYETRSGLVFRVLDPPGGGLRVEVLKQGSWVPGRIGMVGLRLDPTTRKLSPSAIRSLPD